MQYVKVEPSRLPTWWSLAETCELPVQLKWWTKYGRVEGKFVGSCLQWIGKRVSDLELTLA